MTSITGNRQQARTTGADIKPTSTGAAPPTPTDEHVENLEMSVEPNVVDGMSHSTEPTPSAGADNAVAVTKKAFSGLYVSDSDVATAVKALEELPPGEARAALEAMKKDDTFATLVKEADGGERRRLTDLLIRTGMVASTTPAVPAVRGAKSPPPPPPPTLPVLPKDGSDDLKSMLHDENMARGKDYRDAHQAYARTYREAIRNAKDFKELRQIGNITEPNLPLEEPGTTLKQDQREWSKRAARTPDVETMSVVTSKLYSLHGQVPPGGDANLAGSIKLGYGEHNSAVIGGSVSEDRHGATTSSQTIGADLALGPEAASSKISIGTTSVTDASGATTTTSGVKGGIGGTRTRDGKDVDDQPIKDGINASIDPATKSANVSIASGKNKGAVGIGATGVSAKLESANVSAEFTVEKNKQVVSVDAGGAKIGINASDEKITGTIGAAGVSLTGGIDKHGGVVTEAELERKLELGDASIEIKVSWSQTIQLASVDDYRAFVAVIEGGVFEPPPELDRGLKWSQLNDGAKEAYQLFGWTAGEWETARKDKNLRVAMFAGGR